MGDAPTIGIVAAFSTGTGGVETHVLSLLRHADRGPYRFAVFAPLPLAMRARAEGARAMDWQSRSGWDLVAARRLSDLLRRSPVDLLHVQDPRAGVVARCVARWLRIPVVYTVHIPPYVYAAGRYRRWRQWVYRRVEGLLHRTCTDMTIYVSQRIRDQAVRLGVVNPHRTVVVQNGVETSPSRSPVDRQTLGTPASAVVASVAGRLTQQKGVDVLLRAWARLREGAGSPHLWIIGDGPMRASLERQAAQDGLGVLVHFLGERADVPSLLAASDIFVLPSRYEGMPTVLLEAMTAGLPCVATDVGGNAEVVEHDVTGWLVDSDDAVSLSERLALLVRDPALRRRMGDAAKRRVQAFDLHSMVDRTFYVYESVLNDAGHAGARQPAVTGGEV